MAIHIFVVKVLLKGISPHFWLTCVAPNCLYLSTLLVSFLSRRLRSSRVPPSHASLLTVIYTRLQANKSLAKGRNRAWKVFGTLSVAHVQRPFLIISSTLIFSIKKQLIPLSSYIFSLAAVTASSARCSRHFHAGGAGWRPRSPNSVPVRWTWQTLLGRVSVGPLLWCFFENAVFLASKLGFIYALLTKLFRLRWLVIEQVLLLRFYGPHKESAKNNASFYSALVNFENSS